MQKVLIASSSKEYSVSQSALVRELNVNGVPCDRKTIARDIDILIELGYNIVKVKGVGCYLDKDNLFKEDKE